VAEDVAVAAEDAAAIVDVGLSPRRRPLKGGGVSRSYKLALADLLFLYAFLIGIYTYLEY
jgi:hypothetical protein